MGSRKKLNQTIGLHLAAANTCSLQTSGDSKLLTTVQNIHNPTEKLNEPCRPQSDFSRKKETEKALLAYRSTPLSCGSSLAELLMGRKIRTTVPIFHTLLTPKWPYLLYLQEHEAQRKVQQEKYYNTRHRAVPLQKLTEGTEVRIIRPTLSHVSSRMPPLLRDSTKSRLPPE